MRTMSGTVNADIITSEPGGNRIARSARSNAGPDRQGDQAVIPAPGRDRVVVRPTATNRPRDAGAGRVQIKPGDIQAGSQPHDDRNGQKNGQLPRTLKEVSEPWFLGKQFSNG